MCGNHIGIWKVRVGDGAVAVLATTNSAGSKGSEGSLVFSSIVKSPAIWERSHTVDSGAALKNMAASAI